MLRGLMQDDYPLTLQHVLQRMRWVHPDAEVVTLRPGGAARTPYGELCERVDRLGRALRSLGVREGDRVGTLLRNTQEHLELYLAVPCVGAVLHTINVRLGERQLEYVMRHAEDTVVFVEDDLVPLVEKLAADLPGARRWVVVGGGHSGTLEPAARYQELIAAAEGPYPYPRIDERQAAGLCYTSGTTGDPKGVLYSHRSSLLHALGQCGADSLGVSSDDRVMPVVPMFHACAWGLPYSAALAGADLVMPGQFVRSDAIAGLIEQERVTVAAAVPNVWWDLLAHADETHPDLSSIRLLACGGSAVPLTLMRAFEERHSVRVIQVWGLTEASPLTSVARPPAAVDAREHWRLRDRAGRLLPLVEARIVDDMGRELPWDGESVGEIELCGPWIAAAYYKTDAGDRFDGRWLRTGDIGSIDERGFVRITDRAKDVIRSGGEWISSLGLEAAMAAHPGVAEVAVIAKPDERLTERPLACVVPAEGHEPTAAELHGYLSGRMPSWWLPDAYVFLDVVPKTGTGKFDKKLLRRRLAAGALGPLQRGARAGDQAGTSS